MVLGKEVRRNVRAGGKNGGWVVWGRSSREIQMAATCLYCALFFLFWNLDGSTDIGRDEGFFKDNKLY